MAVIKLKVNGREHTITFAEERTRLSEILRDHLELTGTKIGCGVGQCGSCTVLVNGAPVTSCTVLARKTDGAEVLTIEGLSDGNALHPIQRAYLDAGAVQCGFCTPGFVLKTLALLRENPDPSDEQIKTALSKNLCRCTGYEAILEAVHLAAKYMRETG
jgi:aerobic carbon-monoxide dehydrogenase small subunit